MSDVASRNPEPAVRGSLTASACSKLSDLTYLYHSSRLLHQSIVFLRWFMSFLVSIMLVSSIFVHETGAHLQIGRV
jgi:hypothetical protein